MMGDVKRGTLGVEGFELDYTIEGRGRDVLVIGSSVYYPRTFSAALREQVRLIFMDHRGFGRATRPAAVEDFELERLTADVEALRQALGLGQVVVVGHSGHGYLALEYAKRYPEAAAGVVMMAISPDSSPASFAAADQYLEESVCPTRKALLASSMARMEAEMAAEPERRFIVYSLRSGPRIWFDPTYDARPLWDGVTVNAAMFDHVWGTVFRTLDIREGLAALDVPVLVTLGRYDYWNPPHLWEGARGWFHDLRIRIFERSGHTPQLEEAEAFDAELMGWLRDKL